MSGSVKCHHPSLDYTIGSFSFDDEPGKVFVRARVACPACGARFRFLGIPNQADQYDPVTNKTATEVVFPMEEIAR